MRERRARIAGCDEWIGAKAASAMPCGGALASLTGDALMERYCAWRGASERRYIASVFPVDVATVDAGLPAFDAFVLIAVARAAFGRRILFARTIERGQDRRLAIADGLADGVDEWHAHLLADSASSRAAMVVDLERRHAIGRADVDGRGGLRPSPAPLRLAS